ncbi:hypothetical protein F53441_2115 [Fusarium austroafricanum]|uniref:Carrier domain-containing protein n=1 Tax=Fusarium austroafricanum TaxID=2364996 RepID=A0A8H4KT25_9HYPO|nr:hypothetical protein F53441_2115 [Fusarium austroafricanum]
MTTFLRDTEKLEASPSGGAEISQFQKPSEDYAPEHHVIMALVEKIALEDPTRPFSFIPVSDNVKDGWKPVTYAQLINAVNYLAHHISKTITSTEEFPTVAYIGPNDVRYPMMTLACVKAGCKAFFISPRNTTGVQLSLFEATNCSYLYYAEPFISAMKPCLEQRDMQAFTMESLEHFLNVTSPPFPYTKSSVNETRWEPLVVLHTSGSTGTPKPIVVRQGAFYILETMLQQHATFNGYQFFVKEWGKAKGLFTAMPMFHAAGTYLSLVGVFLGIAPVMMFPNKPLSTDTVLETLQHSGADGAILPPSIVEGLAAFDQGMEALTKLQFVSFGGGGLSPVVGDMLAEKGVALRNMIGSTEYFTYAVYLPTDPRNWQYFVIDSEAMGAEWRPRGSNEYELVIRRKDPREPGIQTCFYTFPDLNEWSTRDNYEPHPTAPNHWLCKGRADDVIVFSNGEKLNPVTIESIVLGHPQVNGALVVGQGRFQAALIIEPVAFPKDENEAKAFIDGVWPLIERANEETVAHGRIDPAFVTLSDPKLPFLRAPKGTVQRPPTVKQYADFIETLYEKVEAADEGDTSVTLDVHNEKSLASSLIRLFETKLGVEGLESDTDFFNHGMDSLQATNAAKLLRSILKRSGLDVTGLASRDFYRNPTANQLGAYILSMQHGSSNQDEEAAEIAETERLVAKYTENLPQPRLQKPEPLDDGQTILITGTTGSLGAYMLDQACALPSVKRIIAFNRGDDGGRSRQPSVNEARGLTQDLSKVEFLQVDMSLPDFGLGQSKYDALLTSVDRIIHNAWPVNFNMSMSSFEPFIRGVRHLVDFSAAANKNVPVVFISTIGTAEGWTSSEPLPEKALHDMSLPKMGYGRSKLAGNLILDAAAEKSNIPTAAVRVGQIAGSKGEKGLWNPHEMLPRMIKSSVYLGVLPEHLGALQEVAWVAVEDMAGLILDIAGITAQKPVSEISGYFHGVNPTAVEWSELAPAVKDFYGEGMRIVSLEEWVERLEASEKDEVKNPAVQLLDRYRGMVAAKKQGLQVRYSMERTKGHSPTIREAGPITPGLIRNWCRQWNF